MERIEKGIKKQLHKTLDTYDFNLNDAKTVLTLLEALEKVKALQLAEERSN